MSTIAAEPGTSPHLVEVPRRTCLVAEGQGGPSSEDFRKAMEAVYAVAVTLKLQLALEDHDFVLDPPGVIWSCPAAPFEAIPMGGGWSWKIVFPVPTDVDGQLVRLIKDSLVSRRHLDFAADAWIEELDEGVCAEIVHVGPYDQLGQTLGTLHAFLIESHLAPRGPHHEIYLDDPRVTSPEHVRTLIRQPVG
jgi:hypothetical protein